MVSHTWPLSLSDYIRLWIITLQGQIMVIEFSTGCISYYRGPSRGFTQHIAEAIFQHIAHSRGHFIVHSTQQLMVILHITQHLIFSKQHIQHSSFLHSSTTNLLTNILVYVNYLCITVIYVLPNKFCHKIYVHRRQLPVLVILSPNNAVLCDIIVFSVAIAAKYASKPRGA